MTFKEYKILIERWTQLVNESGLQLSDEKPIPPVFWKTFLGITRSVHLEMMNGTYRRKEFSPGLAQTIRFAERLERDVFLEEVERSIQVFEKNKRK